MAVNVEAAAMKARRAAARAGSPGVPDADVPPEMGVDQPARRFPLLADPREPKIVLGASGMASGADMNGRYVVAAEDAYESILPTGCTTPVSRLRWRKGQKVLKTVYEEHLASLAPEKPAT
jgi:hypothetical protein